MLAPLLRPHHCLSNTPAPRDPLVHWILSADLPRLVLHERACEAGPLPTYTHQSIKAAEEFGERVANVFLDLADHYIDLLTRGEDRSWAIDRAG